MNQVASINISPYISKKIHDTYASCFKRLTGLSIEKISNDLFDTKRAREQIEALRQFLPNRSLKDKKLLEIGSGYGIFQIIAKKEHQCDAWGVEPGSDGFNDAYDISKKILQENNLSPETIINGEGENLPFLSNTFDIVYSTNVLEHVRRPEKVLEEAIRVCRAGGTIQIVTPNYGSFFDGHYACFYVPYQPKWFWKLWIKFVLKNDPSFVDTLRTEINYFTINRWLKKYIKENRIEVLSYGEEIFKERMLTGIFSDWSGLGKVKSWSNLVRKLKLTTPLIYVLQLFKAYTPLIITIRKN